VTRNARVLLCHASPRRVGRCPGLRQPHRVRCCPSISTKFVRSIRGDSDLVARVDPLAARDPGSSESEPKPRNDPLYGNNNGW
jgi:hypothetical protein